MRRGRHGILNKLVVNFDFPILIWFHYFCGLIYHLMISYLEENYHICKSVSQAQMEKSNEILELYDVLTYFK